MTANFWIPPAALSRDGRRYNCLSCGQQGVDQAHVISCSQEHEDVEHGIVASVLGRDGSVFGGQPVDAELEGWVDRHRADLIAGKKKL